jgi:hypothetical protein
VGRQEREDWLLISHFAFRILRKPQQQFGVLDGSTVYPPHDGSSAFPFDNGTQAAFAVHRAQTTESAEPWDFGDPQFVKYLIENYG